MGKWTMTNAMAERILARLIAPSDENHYHTMGWPALIAALRAEESSATWSMARDWLYWAQEQPRAAGVVWCIAITALQSLGTAREAIRNYGAALSNLLIEGDCLPWQEESRQETRQTGSQPRLND